MKAAAGTRNIGSRLFDLHTVYYGVDAKADAVAHAARLRAGGTEGLWGYKGKYLARVVRYDYDRFGLTPDSLKVWAVYCFPKEEVV